jgi:hypothetical protein
MYPCRILLVIAASLATGWSSYPGEPPTSRTPSTPASESAVPCSAASLVACECALALAEVSARDPITRSAVLDPFSPCSGYVAAMLALTEVAALRASPLSAAICLAAHLSQDEMFAPTFPLSPYSCASLIFSVSETVRSALTVGLLPSPAAEPCVCRPTPLNLRNSDDTLALHRTDSETRPI